MRPSMRPLVSPLLIEGYDAYPRVEEAFGDILDESPHPRGPELLYEIVADLALPSGASVLDLGCGEGRHSVRLGKGFRFPVPGHDPVPPENGGPPAGVGPAREGKS